MNKFPWRWLALTWIVAIHLLAYVLLILIPVSVDTWFVLVFPFMNSSQLGIWLTAGYGKGWMRFLGVLMGLCVLIALLVSALPIDPLGFAPGLVTTTATAALGMLLLGCLGSALPLTSIWNVRFALWEVIVSVTIIAIALAILRALLEESVWSWTHWIDQAGIQFLVFSLFTGVLLTITTAPLVLRGRNARVVASLLLFAALTLLPIFEVWAFEALGLRGTDVDLFYRVHIAHVTFGLVTMLPALVAFPGIFIRESPTDP